MGSFGLGHWLVVLVIVLLLFGAGRLSDIGKGLGEGIKNFKKGLADDDEPAPARPVIKTQELVDATPAPKQLAEVPKKKRVIQVEVDDDDDDEAVARKIAESKKAASKTDA
jgi:sec-independent protein translocase protein TatA